jgi:3-hydroxybutyryl-CoA dehydrogenase
MKIEDIHCVLIIGAGTMGQQIGLQCAMHAYDVILYDIVPRSTSIRQRPN